MGHLADYASSEIGQERMTRLRASGDACKTIVSIFMRRQLIMTTTERV